jgi:antitoxin MazE
MRTSIIKIGNSKGLIIPVQLLKECGFEDEVSLQVKNDTLVISKLGKPRERWEETFLRANPDQMIMNDLSNDFDESEWTW